MVGVLVGDAPALLDALRDGGEWVQKAPGELSEAGGGRIVVAGRDDSTVVRLLGETLPGLPGDARVTAVFADHPVVRLYASDPWVEIFAASSFVAQQAVRENPPVLRGQVAAPPIVIGDGPTARELVVAAVAGWGYPGDPLSVHGIGVSEGWAQAAREVAGNRVALCWSEVTLTPGLVARRVVELTDEWQPPPPGHGVAAGPTVLVALDNQHVALAIGTEVVRALPGSRVAVVIDDASAPGEQEMVVISRPRVLAAAVTGCREDPLRRALLDDLAWVCAEDAQVTAPPAPLFSRPRRDDAGSVAGWDVQPTELRDQLSRLAEQLPQVLAAGNVLLGDAQDWDAQPIILAPGELLAMAEQILRIRGIGDVSEARLAALELAFRLPRLAAQAGKIPHRPAGYRQVLGFEGVEGLAPLLHLAYQETALDTSNATESPLAQVNWCSLTDFQKGMNRAAIIGSAIAWAMEGLDWHAVESPVVYPLGDDPELVERLAELEHRRWAQHQRINGRPQRTWMQPWDQLTDDVKEYDRRVVRAMPHLLAHAGIQIA